MGGLFFNDSITIDAFYCIVCENILKPPIILTSMGNICLHHGTHNYEEECLRNNSLELIMEHITCACRYKESGCEEIVKLHEIIEHEESCKFKTFTCLLAGCEWSGLESDYVSHLHEHPNHYIERGSDGMFPLNCYTEGTEAVGILCTISGLSLLHIKVMKDKMICAVYDTNSRYTELYKIWMIYSTSARSKIHNEHICQTVDSLNQLINFESIEGTEIKFRIFSPINNKKVTVCLEHVFKGEIVSSKLKDKSKYDGHLLQLLEKMQVRLPCGNASLGCREQHTPESQHEDTSCYYKSWKCPVETGCKFVGLFAKLVDHIKNNHDSIRHNEMTVLLILSSQKIVFIVYGNIFIMEYKNLLTDPMIESSARLKFNRQNEPMYFQTAREKILHRYHNQQSLDSQRFELNVKANRFFQSDKTLGVQESNDTCQSYPQMRWQVSQLSNHSNASANFGVKVTISSSDGRKSFYLKDGFKKNSLNEDECVIILESNIVKTLLPQCTKARIRIIKMKQ